MPTPDSNRRPLTSRDTAWAKATAAALARARIKPNTISVFSVVFAALAGLCLALTPRFSPFPAAALFITAALGIQLRLLCNLFDGMVAIEGGFKTKTGDVFNELPDRFADAFILTGLGYAAISINCGPTLGWLATALALGTAYIRALGASTGIGQCFLGPMAKPQRMATATAACLLSAAEVFFHDARWALHAALILLVAGTAITILRRTRWILRALEAKP